GTHDWTPEPSNTFAYYPRAYSLKDLRPGWPEDFRVRIEHDMAALPDVNDKWLSVRVEVREGEVHFWLDDHLVAVKTDPSVHAAGLARLDLSPGVQLAALELAPWTLTPGFVPLHLEGYANGRTLLDAASVKPGTTPAGDLLRVAGVPFHPWTI